MTNPTISGTDNDHQSNIHETFVSIFDQLTDQDNGIKKLIQLRKTGQISDSECLSKLQKEFENVKIECDDSRFPENFYVQQYDHSNRVLMNGIELILNANADRCEFVAFVRFLREDVKVQIRKLELKNLYKLNQSHHEKIHNSIFNELIPVENSGHLVELTGLEDICPMGCSQCTSLAVNCEVYGPIQWHALQNMHQRPREYERVLISDRLLCLMAREVLKPERALQQVHDAINDIIPRFTCQNLTLVVTENLKKTSHSEIESQGFPREILDKILETWQPKTIRMEAHASVGTRATGRNDVYHHGRFHEIKMSNQPHAHLQNESLKFQNVTVDLTDSMVNTPSPYYSDETILKPHILQNIRRLFPTDELDIVLPKNHGDSLHFLRELHFFVRAVWPDPQPNLNVNIRMFLKAAHHKNPMGFCHNLIYRDYMYTVEYDENHQTKETHRRLLGVDMKGRKKFVDAVWMGGYCVIRDPRINSEIRVHVSMEAEQFKDYVHNKPQHDNGNRIYLSFEKIFLDPEHASDCSICKEAVASAS